MLPVERKMVAGAQDSASMECFCLRYCTVPLIPRRVENCENSRDTVGDFKLGRETMKGEKIKVDSALCNGLLS